MSFPDYPYLNDLARSLWSRGLNGHAAAMVGAGFSFNAVRSRHTTRAFPSWMTLVGRMIEELYPPGVASLERTRERADTLAASVSGALRIAQEYEAMFGRVALDELMRYSIPDDAYAPGPLHSSFLSLPWSDVLTTNYDTLLERAAQEIEDYSYSCVRTQADLTAARRPRIIKLHGSFPAHRPFIVTEEDFRTYPKEFPALVNAAQQTFVENVVCLIGFSGDDPNFLQWTGWVRDCLGAAIRRIYLLGVLQLVPSQRKVLEERSVIPIDLSPLFPEEDWKDSSSRHAAAHEWAFRELRSYRPPNVLAWPLGLTSVTEVTARAGLPPSLKTLAGDLLPEPRMPPHG